MQPTLSNDLNDPSPCQQGSVHLPYFRCFEASGEIPSLILSRAPESEPKINRGRMRRDWALRRDRKNIGDICPPRTPQFQNHAMRESYDTTIRNVIKVFESSLEFQALFASIFEVSSTGTVSWVREGYLVIDNFMNLDGNNQLLHTYRDTSTKRLLEREDH